MNTDQIWDSAMKECKMLHALKPIVDEMLSNPYAMAREYLNCKIRIQELEFQLTTTKGD